MLMLLQPSPPIFMHQRMHDVLKPPQRLLHVGKSRVEARLLVLQPTTTHQRCVS